MKLLFKNARIIDVKSPYNGQELDILVNDEQIEAIGNLSTEQAEGVMTLRGVGSQLVLQNCTRI